MKFLILAAIGLSLACNDRTTDPQTPPNSVDTPDMTEADATSDMDETGCAAAGEVRVGAWNLTLDTDGVLKIQGPDVQLLSRSLCSAEAPGVRMMRGGASVREAFGAFQIDLEPEGNEAQWFAGKNGVRMEESEDGAEITVPVENSEVRIQLTPDAEDGLRVQLVADEADAYVGGELSLECDGAAYFGLGSQVTGMDLGGRTYPLWTQEQGNGKPESGSPFPLKNIPEAAYAPMGIWHASTGWTGLVTHDGYSEIDLCETDAVRLRSYQAFPGMVILSGTPRERLTKATEFTGRNQGVPDWVFGFWVNAVGGPARVDEVAQTVRDRGILASAIWTEDWIGGTSTDFGYRLSYAWEWDQEMYPNLPEQVDSLHERGFAFLAYFNPFVPQTTRMYQEGVDGGYLIKDDAGEVIVFSDPAFRQASLVDLTNPEALEWSQGYQRRAIQEIGADGWMVDFAEWLPTNTRLDNGLSGWDFHNLYPVAWQTANREMLEAELGETEAQWTYFARSGWASANGGTPGVAPTLWAGDQDTSWDYEDGFPTIFPIGAHLGMSGVAVYGSDIAGYSALSSPPTTKELFFRWMAAGAFHPLMRTHHGGAECENWSFDRDEETLLHTARYSRIHGRLLPYFRQLMEDAREFGWPIVRHPYLVEGDSPALWETEEYQYFLGDNILVAPVMTEAAVGRDVVLPGLWWPLFGESPVAAAEVRADAAVGEIPVFVRPGVALELMPEVDSFYPAVDAEVRDLSSVNSRIVALYPDENGSAASDSDLEITVQGLENWDPASLPECSSELPCVEGSVVRVVAETGESQVAGISLSVVAIPEGVTVLELGLAGDAWGALRTPSAYSPNPDAPTWCE